MADRVADGAILTAGGSVTVGSSIEAATIRSGGDLVVRRGILGRSRGRATAAGSIAAKFASDAHLIAGNNLLIGKQLMNSTVCVGGRIIASKAALIGGNLFASGCVEVHHLGSEANVATRLVVGVVTQAVHELAEVSTRIRRTMSMAERMRTLLQPPREVPRPLDDRQREFVAACLSLADKAEARARSDAARRDELHGQVYTTTVPSIQIHGTIYGGVTIQLGNRATVFRNDYEGPVRLECRKLRNVTEIVAIHPNSSAVKVLRSERTPVETLVEGTVDDARGDKR